MSHDPYFFVDHLSAKSVVEITGEDANHLAKVRRAIPGDRVTLSDGAGGVAEAEIETAEPGRVRVKTGDVVVFPQPTPKIAVYQALAKQDKVDLAITKLVELNVQRLVVFQADRSIPRWSAAKSSKALERWKTLAVEASKQSRRSYLPEVEGVLGFEDAVGSLRSSAGLVLIAHSRHAGPLRDAMPEAVEEVAVVIGPEGGLSDHEVDRLTGIGGSSVSLGPTVLRTETAGLAAACMVMYRYGLMG